MKKLTSIIVPLLLFSIYASAQEKKGEKNPIDERMAKCLSIDSNMTTLGMNNCVYAARDEWDKELNKYYKLLMDSISADEKAKLKEAQRSWILYRDNETKFSYTLYGNMDGTMWTNVSAMRSLEIIKQRALELKVYYEEHKFK